MDDASLKKGQEMAKNLPAPAFFVRPADALAADPTMLTPFYVAKGQGTITALQIVMGADVTLANGSIALTRYRSGSAVLVATVGSGSWTAMVPNNIGSLANVDLQDGDVLGIVVSKSGPGILLPSLLALVAIEAG